jgi:non-ribosomal peptide synthetase component E (peptide arylation enzyme)
MPGIYASIDIINLSPSGYDVMVKGQKGAKTEIFKNGESIAEL